MMEFFTVPQNAAFTIALFVVVGLAAVELLSLLIGMGASEALDSLLPDLDLDIDADLDVDGDADLAAGPGPMMAALGWLRVGEVPALILLVLLLTSFALAGLTIQWILHSFLGFLLPASIAWIPAAFAAIPLLRWSGGWAVRIVPKEESSAVSQETFIGREAVIVLGSARRGAPTQARLRDEHGRSHYVMVEPADDEEEFASGERVLLTSHQGALFRVIRSA